jgi:hypothetical protein
VPRLQKNHILIDGAPTQGQGLLLQIFTANQIGPIFFELIQRKGNEGFGEGNFRALFESIEADQIRRGVSEGDHAHCRWSCGVERSLARETSRMTRTTIICNFCVIGQASK